ncbi:MULTISPECIES: hypothetical protein [unclassified Streptomyces]|uniref:hypothetical protein n=1 Tax=unclassified Streptomyces TaxID=2593676 RepID=UPI002E27C0AE|nr:hypothetical protein [Streptomyces sp. NBC_00228]
MAADITRHTALSMTIGSPTRLRSSAVPTARPSDKIRKRLALSLDTALPAVRNWAEEHMTEVDRANELSDGQGGES